MKKLLLVLFSVISINCFCQVTTFTPVKGNNALFIVNHVSDSVINKTAPVVKNDTEYIQGWRAGFFRGDYYRDTSGVWGEDEVLINKRKVIFHYSFNGYILTPSNPNYPHTKKKKKIKAEK